MDYARMSSTEVSTYVFIVGAQELLGDPLARASGKSRDCSECTLCNFNDYSRMNG